nr:hypothetical protein [Tanacetum cinerariifolium]
MELVIAKCLNSPEYLSALGTAVSKAIEKGMHDSIKALMNILHLEEHLAKGLGLNESKTHADQLMVPIYHSLDKAVVSASALSLTLDVFDAPLTGMECTSDVVPATADITTALSVTLAFVGAVTPFLVDDYGVMGTDDQSAVKENVLMKMLTPFPMLTMRS